MAGGRPVRSHPGRRFALGVIAIGAVLWLRASIATTSSPAPTISLPQVARQIPSDAALMNTAAPILDAPPPPPFADPPPPAPRSTSELAHICGSAEFAPDSPRLDVAVFVFAWRRLASLQRLINSLQSAEYCGFNISLTILLDVGASPAVIAYSHAIRWAHGRQRVVEERPPPECEGSAELRIAANASSWGAVRGKCVGQGIRGMWIDVLGRELSAHEPPTAHPLPLEDDTEVSPLFYWWLRRAARAYGPFDTRAGAWTSGAVRLADGGATGGGATGGGATGGARSLPPSSASRLVGVSLYAPRLDEIHYPSRHWRPRWPSAARTSPAFLFCLPCSWGALYFRAQWEAFLRFYRLRTAPPLYDFASEAAQKGKLAQREPLGDRALAIPNCRASTWARSWKRFMIDFMYARGDVMLYPNAPADESPGGRYTSLSFSTTYMERGAHSGTDGHFEIQARDELRPSREHDKRKTVPLVSRVDVLRTLDALATMPAYDRLPAISLLHVRASGGLSELASRGRQFLEDAEKQTRASRGQFGALRDAWLAPYADGAAALL